MVKKSQWKETGIILIKNGHSTFHTGKPGNFNSLREDIWLILWHCFLKIDWKWESMPKKAKRCGYQHPFRWYVCTGRDLEAPGSYQQTLL